jgi:hypothetical protein
MPQKLRFASFGGFALRSSHSCRAKVEADPLKSLSQDQGLESHNVIQKKKN